MTTDGVDLHDLPVDTIDCTPKPITGIVSKYGQAKDNAVVESYELSPPEKPTDEELMSLPRVSGKLPWNMFTIAFVELCERFSYYGAAVLYTNFVNHPLPPGSTTGAAPDGLPGALGMGPKAAQGISLFNQFFAYLTPLLGAWVADARMGRFWTLHLAIGISTFAHVVLVAAAAPTVIVQSDTAFGVFIIGLLCLCVGTGFFKANVSPLLAEQNEDNCLRIEIQNGKRVIVDPAITNSRIFLWFYFFINIGSLAGQISMVYVEKYRGFWLAFLIPTILFLISPAVLWSQHHKYKLTPPTGSLISKFIRVIWFVEKHSKGIFKLNWEVVKPSQLVNSERPSWMNYDDAWIDEIRRGLVACKVFLFLPVFFLAYNQMTGNLTIQAGTMQLHGVPNDIIQNLNPISIIVMVPLIDHILYPLLRRIGVAFTPIKRMTAGFFMAMCAMVASAVMQYYIYRKSPCGWYANSSIDGVPCDPAPINVWAQCLPYILIGLAEVLTNVTSYEYAFSKAPENMKSLVMAINLFMSAVSAAIGQAFTPLSDDPLLVWNYTAIACIAFFGGIAFWVCFRHLDSDEDKWNMLEKTKFVGRAPPSDLMEKPTGVET